MFFIFLCVFFSTDRTEKVPMGSIKNVVSEPIEGHEDYHMMVTVHVRMIYIMKRHNTECCTWLMYLSKMKKVKFL